jgi:hypothetical protein
VTYPHSVNQIMGVLAQKAGYSQPCRPSIEQWRDGVADGVDIHLVADATLETSGRPNSLAILPSTLSGVVFEQVPGGVRPISGAKVTADFAWGMSRAGELVTYSDRAGRYFLCGFAQPYHPFWDEGAAPFPSGRAALSVSKSGFTSQRLDVDVRTSSTVHVELVAQ